MGEMGENEILFSRQIGEALKIPCTFSWAASQRISMSLSLSVKESNKQTGAAIVEQKLI